MNSMSNLYGFNVEGAEFTNFCGGAGGTSPHESCVDIASIPGAQDGFVVRDTKTEGAGRELRMTGSELDDFAVGWAKKRGLAL